MPAINCRSSADVARNGLPRIEGSAANAPDVPGAPTHAGTSMACDYTRKRGTQARDYTRSTRLHKRGTRARKSTRHTQHATTHGSGTTQAGPPHMPAAGTGITRSHGQHTAAVAAAGQRRRDHHTCQLLARGSHAHTASTQRPWRRRGTARAGPSRVLTTGGSGSQHAAPAMHTR